MHLQYSLSIIYIIDFYTTTLPTSNQKKGSQMEYQTINEIPEAYQFIFKKLIEKGALKPDRDGQLHISHDMFEIVLLLARLGLVP